MVTCFRDRLPKHLCFPLGQQPLSAVLPDLERRYAALYFVWQSTWAAQIFNPEGGEDGLLALLKVSAQPPRMRTSAARVKARPDKCQVAVSEFAVSSGHRHEVREAFVASGSRIIGNLLSTSNIEPFMVYYRLGSGSVSVRPNRHEVWVDRA
jgi:hypothetical protein